MYTLMFILSLFTIARTWKQLQCPSMDKEDISIYLYIIYILSIYNIDRYYIYL